LQKEKVACAFDKMKQVEFDFRIVESNVKEGEDNIDHPK